MESSLCMLRGGGGEEEEQEGEALPRWVLMQEGGKREEG